MPTSPTLPPTPHSPSNLSTPPRLPKASRMKASKLQRGEVSCGACLIPSPHLVFIGGSHGQGECVLQLILQEPMSTSNQELPRRRLKLVWAHGLVGRPGWSSDHPVGPTDLGLLQLGCVLGPHVIGAGLGFWYVGFLLWWAL